MVISRLRLAGGEVECPIPDRADDVELTPCAASDVAGDGVVEGGDGEEEREAPAVAVFARASVAELLDRDVEGRAPEVSRETHSTRHTKGCRQI